jgi:hypothetical protein
MNQIKAPLWCVNCNKWTIQYNKNLICFCGNKVSYQYEKGDQ